MSKRTVATIFMIISALSFSFMAATVKLSGDLPVFEKVFFRNFVSLIIVLISLLKIKNVNVLGEKRNRKFLLARSLCGFAGIAFYFYTLSKLYLADSVMLNKISPFFVLLFSAIFLKEKLTRIQVIAVIIAFLAALLIIKPRFDLSIIPSLIGLASAVTAGAAYVLVKVSTNRGEKPVTIIFYFSLITSIGSFGMMLFNFVMPSPVQWIWLILTGVFGAGGQFFLTYAYKFAKASEVAIYKYLNIIFAALIGFIVWYEIPDVFSILGGVIVITASALMFFYHKQRA